MLTPYGRYRSVGTRQPGSQVAEVVAENPRRPTHRPVRYERGPCGRPRPGPSTIVPLSHSHPYQPHATPCHAMPCHVMPILCQYAFTAPSANIAAFQHCSIAALNLRSSPCLNETGVTPDQHPELRPIRRVHQTDESLLVARFLLAACHPKDVAAASSFMLRAPFPA